jgi:ubiquinone/menaquinone biosynthesis C-methylase UbiE
MKNSIPGHPHRHLLVHDNFHDQTNWPTQRQLKQRTNKITGMILLARRRRRMQGGTRTRRNDGILCKNKIFRVLNASMINTQKELMIGSDQSCCEFHGGSRIKDTTLTYMSFIKKLVKSGCDAILNPFGYEIRKKISKAEGFPEYLIRARKTGMDVNDWEEQVLGWSAALPILEQTVFPYLKDNSIVCNLGVGTGRWARHVAPRLFAGELHLVDHSLWTVNFAREYFGAYPNVHTHLNNGFCLPFPEYMRLDLIFSFGTFIELQLGVFYLYSREIFRFLKPGGYCVIHYLDVTAPGGWHWLETSSNELYANCYTYHSREVVERVFSSVGFEVISSSQIAGGLLTVRKPQL